MESYIELENIKFYAYHGVSETERKVGNNYEVYLKVNLSLEKAAITDNLEDTVNYALLYDCIKKEMMIPSNLLEHVAGRIITAICKKHPVIWGGSIKISKIKPPISGDIERASVSFSW
ncbi:dihydroneopterin aldolase [Coprobacter tertius]|uniref:7,8-dihydroneopterin aldolase n=1 Tax=Coprobacter tertius TaxID=2944915 RepID=A0ABT1ML01_9BACT|nr:dihydroneopterin aldolase [Coprobacter tertius]MCP9612729.1 dihydroneopterin aldolase [Coprobacter tertius]